MNSRSLAGPLALVGAACCWAVLATMVVLRITLGGGDPGRFPLLGVGAVFATLAFQTLFAGLLSVRARRDSRPTARRLALLLALPAAVGIGAIALAFQVAGPSAFLTGEMPNGPETVSTAVLWSVGLVAVPFAYQFGATADDGVRWRIATAWSLPLIAVALVGGVALVFGSDPGLALQAFLVTTVAAWAALPLAVVGWLDRPADADPTAGQLGLLANGYGFVALVATVGFGDPVVTAILQPGLINVVGFAFFYGPFVAVVALALAGDRLSRPKRDAPA